MNRRPLRIAVIGPRGVPSAYSGIERVAESLYSELAARGHAVTVYSRPEYVERSPAYYRGIRLLRTPACKGRALGTLSHVAASHVHALLRERYDVIHLHALAPGLIAPLCRWFGVPTVATVQGLDWRRAKWTGLGSVVLRRAERMMVRYVDEIVAVSRDLEEYFLVEYERRTVRIPNGTDPTPADASRDAEVLCRHGLRPREFVLFVARLVPEKRPDDLLRAFRLTKTPYRLVVVGDSSHTDDYVAGLRRLAAGDARIVFAGTQPRERLDALFRTAALYVLPSELEGMPMALLQALEVGLPAIVSDLPVHRELLESFPDYDLFFAPRHVELLASRLTLALARLDHYRGLAARIQEHVRATYAWPAIASRFEALYYELAARRRRQFGRVSTTAVVERSPLESSSP
jgi:glycosyltransferase involved in cell wall biosynthesis